MSYNKFSDTYIKQKTSGSISGYGFRVDGNSYFSGDATITGNLILNSNNVQTSINTNNTKLTDQTNLISTEFIESVNLFPLNTQFTDYSLTVSNETVRIKNGT